MTKKEIAREIKSTEEQLAALRTKLLVEEQMVVERTGWWVVGVRPDGTRTTSKTYVGRTVPEIEEPFGKCFRVASGVLSCATGKNNYIIWGTF